ncbi:MAG: XTP/dITP diphosphatase [Chloroflexi bacterium]|nr:XTP/dITP diphosphatase [Chloroflexota bacterium]
MSSEPRSGHTRLLIATHNRGKVAEYQELLAGLPFELVSLDQVGIADEVEENGSTFAENARAKAVEYARRSGMPALADDSGLEVDALGGEPGVRSNRYAGPNKSDADRNAFLLDKLREVPRARRTARFRCVIAIAAPGRAVHESEGTCEGVIEFAPRGSNGFGYDPIFYFPELDATMAELPAEVKNRVSHRGRAVQRAREILRRLLSSAA